MKIFLPFFSLLLCIEVCASSPYWWSSHNVNLTQKKNGKELATYAEVKSLIEKTVQYFESSFENGANEQVKSLLKEKWFLQKKNQSKTLKVKEFKEIVTPIYDNLLQENPRVMNRLGFETSWNTHWMMNVTPFYESKKLMKATKGPTKPRQALFNKESHYPWDKEGKIIRNKDKVTIDLLKYVFSFELPQSKDDNPREIINDVTNPLEEYRYYEPSKISNSEKLPLYIFLTGDNGYGHDPSQWARQGKQKAFTVEIKHAVNQNINFIIKTISTLSKHKNIDSKRIYVLGFSRGGVSIIDLINRRPDLLTAAWIIDPGVPRMGLPDNPFKDSDWFKKDNSNAQVKFASQLKKNNVTVLISPASAYTNRAISTPDELLKLYKLLVTNGVKAYYSVLPRHHGPAQQSAFLDYRYWNFLSSLRKN